MTLLHERTPTLTHGLSAIEPVASYLYLPGHRAHALLPAALASPAQAIVFDLEDLVPPADKAAARLAVARILAAPVPVPAARKPFLVRINGTESGHHGPDIDAVVQPGLAALRIPKAESADQVRAIARRLEAARARAGIVAAIGLQPMVESASGLEQAARLARASHLVWSLGLGEGDLRADLGVDSDAGLAHARSHLVLASRAAGLPGPVQVTFAPGGSPEALRASTWLGRQLGFSGRSLLDPWHAQEVNAIYAAP